MSAQIIDMQEYRDRRAARETLPRLVSVPSMYTDAGPVNSHIVFAKELQTMLDEFFGPVDDDEPPRAA